jgi:general secretion pathway protein G
MVSGCSKRPVANGFTLIELLVTLAIVALLLTLAMPRYFGGLQSAKEQVLRENLRTVRETIDKFYGSMGRYPSNLQELVDRRFLRTLPVDPVTERTDTWVLIAPPDAAAGETAVYDIRSGATGAASNGQAFGSW